MISKESDVAAAPTKTPPALPPEDPSLLQVPDAQC